MGRRFQGEAEAEAEDGRKGEAARAGRRCCREAGTRGGGSKEREIRCPTLCHLDEKNHREGLQGEALQVAEVIRVPELPEAAKSRVLTVHGQPFSRPSAAPPRGLRRQRVGTY